MLGECEWRECIYFLCVRSLTRKFCRASILPYYGWKECSKSSVAEHYNVLYMFIHIFVYSRETNETFCSYSTHSVRVPLFQVATI